MTCQHTSPINPIFLQKDSLRSLKKVKYDFDFLLNFCPMGWTVLGLGWGLEKYYFFHYPIMAQQCFFGRGGCSSILTSKWWLNRLTNLSAPLINPGT